MRWTTRKRRPWVVAGVLAIGVGMTAGAAPSMAQGNPNVQTMVLWNHLNSLASTQDSAIGAGFEVVGTPMYFRGYTGRAVGETDDGSYLLMPEASFFGPDRHQGTVTVHLEKRMEASVPYQTPLVGVFGGVPYGPPTNYAIQAQWGDGLSGPAGLYFDVYDASGTLHRATDGAFNTAAVPVGQWVRVDFVWDTAGIAGSSDRLRIYRDGQLVASNADVFDTVATQSTPVSFAGAHATYRMDGAALLLDELVVREGAVTP